LIILNAVCLIFSLFVVRPAVRRTVSPLSQEAMVEEHESFTVLSLAETKLVFQGCVLLIVANALGRGMVSLLETIGAPMVKAALIQRNSTGHHDYQQDTNMFFLILGTFGLGVYGLLASNRLKCGELNILVIMFGLYACGCIFLLSHDVVPLWRLYVGGGLIWSISTPLSGAITLSAFSKLVGNQPQGWYMSIITAAGGIGRIIIPLLGGFLSPFGVLLGGIVLNLLCGVALFIFRMYADRRKRLASEMEMEDILELEKS